MVVEREALADMIGTFEFKYQRVGYLVCYSSLLSMFTTRAPHQHVLGLWLMFFLCESMSVHQDNDVDVPQIDGPNARRVKKEVVASSATTSDTASTAGVSVSSPDATTASTPAVTSIAAKGDANDRTSPVNPAPQQVEEAKTPLTAADLHTPSPQPEDPRR